MNNAAVDITVGLLLVYVLFSLACVILNQFIGRIAGLRASTLQAGLSKLLDDQNVKDAFYNHGLIANARAVSGGRHPSHLEGATFAMALIGSLDNSQPLPDIAEFDKIIKKLPYSRIRDILLAHLSTASGDIGRFSGMISSWYDENMAQLRTVYKRRMRMITLAVATLLVVAANADTFALARVLWSDRPIRDQIARASSDSIAADASAPYPSHYKSPPYPLTTLSYLKRMHDQIRPFPLGWSTPMDESGKNRSAFHFWAKKLLGLLTTIAFVTCGASVCFDLLTKVIDHRKVGRPRGRWPPAHS